MCLVFYQITAGSVVPRLSPIHKEKWLINSCYFYFPRIFYTITWLLWNATSRDLNIVVKLTYYRFDRLRSKKTHIIIMVNMKTGTICNIRASNDDWKVIGTHFDGLVFRIFLSEDCYTFWHRFSRFQLELARPNYINRNIKTFEKFLLIQKALVRFKQGKIVFVKVESSLTRNIWKRLLIQTLRRY